MGPNAARVLSWQAGVLAIGVVGVLAAASERTLLAVGAVICICALIGWEVWRLRSRQRSGS